jgi:hypothetical protein
MICHEFIDDTNSEIQSLVLSHFKFVTGEIHDFISNLLYQFIPVIDIHNITSVIESFMAHRTAGDQGVSCLFVGDVFIDWSETVRTPFGTAEVGQTVSPAEVFLQFNPVQSVRESLIHTLTSKSFILISNTARSFS